MRLTSKHISIPKNKNQEFKHELQILYSDSLILKRIREITNECLCNGAYSSKNEIEQFEKLERVKAPQWEIDILGKAIKFKRKLAHKTLEELEQLLTKFNDIVD